MDYLIDRAACLAIAACCRDPDRRFIGTWKDGHNSRWRPHTVKRPGANGAVFTDEAAWSFIAELIENHQAIRIVDLDTPPGTTGYMMTVAIADGPSDLYIKLALTKSGKVIGRSFHYSGE